jgi:hypothetical protein
MTYFYGPRQFAYSSPDDMQELENNLDNIPNLWYLPDSLKLTKKLIGKTICCRYQDRFFIGRIFEIDRKYRYCGIAMLSDPSGESRHWTAVDDIISIKFE